MKINLMYYSLDNESLTQKKAVDTTQIIDSIYLCDDWYVRGIWSMFQILVADFHFKPGCRYLTGNAKFKKTGIGIWPEMPKAYVGISPEMPNT